MNAPKTDAARMALSQIFDPATQQDIVSLGWVQSLNITGSVASCVLEIDPARAAELEPIRKTAENAIKSVSGIEIARVIMTAEAKAAKIENPSGAPSQQSPTPSPPSRPQPAPPQQLEHVRRIIAVASGKGGVGKSTVSTNLAAALAETGERVGLLDADVYGPSLPRMLGLSERPTSPDGQTLVPLRRHGLTMISLGLMVGEGEAIVWRGPMLMKALQQLLFQVDWGELDTLIVDLPPGTGDVQMTLCQRVSVTGAIVVSTPQDIALIDARKGIDMFAKMRVPILGIVENMSGFECETCGTIHHPFGQGGGGAMAKELGIPYLGEIPLELCVRESGDEGEPVVIKTPNSAAAQAFKKLAQSL